MSLTGPKATVIAATMGLAGTLAAALLGYHQVTSRWPWEGVSESSQPLAVEGFRGSWINRNAGGGAIAAVKVSPSGEATARVHLTRWGPTGVRDLGSKVASLRDGTLATGSFVVDSVRSIQLTLMVPQGETMDVRVDRISVGQLGTGTVSRTIKPHHGRD